MSEGPASDADIPGWLARVGVPGLVDAHVHFLPDRMMSKVWAYFDNAEQHYGMSWPVTYRYDESERVRLLRSFGVRAFAPLVYPHKPGMAEWLNGWVLDFAERTPGAVPTATLFPEPAATRYVTEALEAGVRCVKAHVQVGRYDPREELLDKAWGLIADAGIPAIIHCGHGPLRGKFTGMDIISDVLARHPRLTAVVAHAGMPDFTAALRLAQRYQRVYLDTTMVGTPFSEATMPLPADWTARLAGLGDRLVLGTDFPNIPHTYAEQLRAIAGWAAADDRLGDGFLHRVLHDTPARLLALAP
ncbi:MAG: amidohydrolase family protein [Sciscionella sp.]